METRNNKLYGIYNNEMELQEEMDRLRARGYGEEDMYIVSNHNQQLSMYRGSSSYMNDEKEGSWWDRFKAFLLGEDLVRDKYFTQMGFSDEGRNRYYDELQAGKYLLYVDKEYGTYFDEGASNYGIDATHATDYDSDVETNYTKTEANLYDTAGNLDDSLAPKQDSALHRTDR